MCQQYLQNDRENRLYSCYKGKIVDALLFELIVFPQTAYTTQWMLYLLARNRKLQEEICEEVMSAANSEHIVQLPVLRGMLRETLRLYPVAPFLTRYLPQDSLIGGYHVPAGVRQIPKIFMASFRII